MKYVFLYIKFDIFKTCNINVNNFYDFHINKDNNLDAGVNKLAYGVALMRQEQT